MAEMPEVFFAATFPRGYVGRGGKELPPGTAVPAPAILLLALLWRWIDWNWHRRTDVPLFVFPAVETLADRRGIGTRAIEEQIRMLIAAGLVRRGRRGKDVGFFLARPAEKDQAVCAESKVNSDRSMDRGSPIQTAPSPINGSEIADRSIGGSPINGSGDLRSIDHGHKEEHAIELASERANELGRAPAAFRKLARHLLAEAIPPDDCEALSSSALAEKNLAALLAEGEPIEVVRAVLRAAPAIVAAKLQELRWYRPEMFCGERWTKWRDALGEWRRRERETAAAAERLAREEAERAERQARADRARADFEAAAPLRAQQASVLLTSSMFTSDTFEEIRRRGAAREADERRAESQALEHRLAMVRALSDTREQLGRPLTADEANAIRVRFGGATQSTPAGASP